MLWVERSFVLSIGCHEPPIEQQLKEYSLWLDLPLREQRFLQQDANEVSRLFARGVLARSEAEKAQCRIMKTIKRHLKPMEAQP
jgi:hypothetical protein